MHSYYKFGYYLKTILIDFHNCTCFLSWLAFWFHPTNLQLFKYIHYEFVLLVLQTFYRG